MKEIEAHIMQQSYLLGCPEGQEARLLEAVERIDTAMTKIRDVGKVRARERIAVLAALNIAFDCADHTATEEAAAEKKQILALLERLDQALNLIPTSVSASPPAL